MRPGGVEAAAKKTKSDPTTTTTTEPSTLLTSDEECRNGYLVASGRSDSSCTTEF